jgi:hypothetical protein
MRTVNALVVVSALTLLATAAARQEELFDGGEVNASRGRVQLPRAPGATKLYLLADGEFAPGGKG